MYTKNIKKKLKKYKIKKMIFLKYVKKEKRKKNEKNKKINFKCNKNVTKILKLNSLLRLKDYFF